MSVRRIMAVSVLTIALAAAAACGASGTENSAEAEGSAGTTAQDDGRDAASDGAFGSLDAVCGPGDFSVEPTEQGLDNGKLNLGVATDRKSSIRPGLNKEMWDSSVAFAEWCNDQGGIGGLEINLVELSAALFDVEAAMSVACTDVFAMVGGGVVQDNMEFSGKESSDFHQCGMIDIPGYAASLEKSGSNGMVQPVPNNPTTLANTWFRDYREVFPDEAENVVIVYGDLATLEITKDKYEVALEDVGMNLVDTLTYPVTGMSDWTPMAQRVLDSEATTMIFVGEPNNLAALVSSLRQQGWDGIPLLETNMYDQLLFSAGDEGPEGAVIRMTMHPVEEASEWPAVQQYLDLLEEYVPDFKTGTLGIQSISAWLLFATAANACGEANDGVLDRTCILEEAAAVEDWTGGGLHGAVEPDPYDTATTSSCGMLLVARDGKFERLYPEIGGEDDDGGGFHCPENGVTQIPANEGTGAVDPDRPI